MSYFYNVKDLSLETKKNILKEAVVLAYLTSVQQLDSNISFSRTISQISVEDMINIHLNNSCHFAVIERIKDGVITEVEISFCSTNKKPDLFLFNHLNLTSGKEIIEKYNLARITN